MMDEQLEERCDICDGKFTLIDEELVPAVDTIIDEDKYYIDVCDDCVEKYKIDTWVFIVFLLAAFVIGYVF